MKFTWDLNGFFETTDDVNLEVENIKNMLSNIKKYENKELNENLILELLDNKWKIKELTNNILVYGSLMYYKNIKSDECIKIKSFAEEFANQVDLELSFVDRKILELGIDKINHFISKNKKLETYRFYLNNLFRKQEHFQDYTIDNEIKDNINKINKELNSYNSLIKDVKFGYIDVNGKVIEITSSNLSQNLSSKDREVRKQTYLLLNQKYKNEIHKFAKILDSIFSYRIKNAKLEKYDSVLDRVLFEENINPEIVELLIKQVNSNVNLIQRYLKIKSDLLNLNETHLYDISAPLNDNLKIEYTLEDAINIIRKALQPLGEKYLTAVNYLLEGHIDALPDDNKHQSITFSWHTYAFMNYRGTYSDLKNMIHEIGHIVNYYFSKINLPFIYEDSSIFVGEISSIVNEILLNRYLYENAKSKEEKIFYLNKKIENYFISVFKQTMYTEFEKDLYNIKSSSTLTPELLSNHYASIVKKYYGKDIIYDELFNVEWTRLGHLYRWSYYSYKYATGLIIANIVVNGLTNEHIISKDQYLKFLSSGSSLYSEDLLKILNINLINSDVINNGFNELREDIGELEKVLTPKS